MTEWIGTVGACFGCSSLVPQIYQCYCTKSTKDLSWITFGLQYISIVFNVIFGIFIGHPAIVFSSLVTFVFISILAGMKMKFDRNEYLAI